jgi:hypothetical protein
LIADLALHPYAQYEMSKRLIFSGKKADALFIYPPLDGHRPFSG